MRGEFELGRSLSTAFISRPFRSSTTAGRVSDLAGSREVSDSRSELNAESDVRTTSGSGSAHPAILSMAMTTTHVFSIPTCFILNSTVFGQSETNISGVNSITAASRITRNFNFSRQSLRRLKLRWPSPTSQLIPLLSYVILRSGGFSFPRYQPPPLKNKIFLAVNLAGKSSRFYLSLRSQTSNALQP